MTDKPRTGRRTFIKEVAAAGIALRGVRPLADTPSEAGAGTAAQAGVARKKNVSVTRARIPAASSRWLRFHSAASAPGASASAAAASCAIGRSTTVRTRGAHQSMCCRLSGPTRGDSKPVARVLEARLTAAVRGLIRAWIRQRSRIEPARTRQLHRRVPAGAHFVHGFAASGSRRARRLQPFRPARRRGIRVSGRHPAIPRAQSRPGHRHRVGRFLDRQSGRESAAER